MFEIYCGWIYQEREREGVWVVIDLVKWEKPGRKETKRRGYRKIMFSRSALPFSCFSFVSF